MMLSRVDLPQPDAPTRQTNSPASTCRLMSSRASTLPCLPLNCFEMPLTSRCAVMRLLLRPRRELVAHGAQGKVACQAEKPDDGDGDEDLVDVQELLRTHNAE